MQLENNPTKTPQQQVELATKKKELQELEQNNSLTVRISNLEREIKELEGKTTRTNEEEVLLADKKKQLVELLAKQNSSTSSAKPTDKTTLIVGCGIIAVVLIGLVFILVRRNKSKKH